jgi:hypothetical protein
MTELSHVATSALYLLPALLLAVALLARRFPGADALERAIERRRSSPAECRQRPRSAAAPPRRPRGRHPVRGGLVIASSLAGRGPPACA